LGQEMIDMIGCCGFRSWYRICFFLRMEFQPLDHPIPLNSQKRVLF